jgi:3-methyladenine DNA glycosylase AlkD
MQSILSQIRADLKANADDKTRDSAKRFFKEAIKVYGVKTATTGKISKKYWPTVKTYGKLELFALCEELFRSDYLEEASIVADWLPKYMHYLGPEDLMTFKRWIETYINNWAKCDTFCNIHPRNKLS